MFHKGGGLMESVDAIDYIEHLNKGDFLTVNIPIFRDKVAKEMFENYNITIDKKYKEIEAKAIFKKFKYDIQKIKRKKEGR